MKRFRKTIEKLAPCAVAVGVALAAVCAMVEGPPPRVITCYLLGAIVGWSARIVCEEVAA